MHRMQQRPTAMQNNGGQSNNNSNGNSNQTNNNNNNAGNGQTSKSNGSQAAQTSLQAIQAQAVHQVRVNRQAVHRAAQVRASRQAAPAHHLQVSLNRHRLHSLQQKTRTRAKLGTMQSIKPKKCGQLMRKATLGNVQYMKTIQLLSVTLVVRILLIALANTDIII